MTSPRTDSLVRDNYTGCPIPQTHRRLVEAHLLWHQALDNYQEPEAFRANLNALIQALRNVTWILQSEKRAFPEFDAWYEPWQDLMAGQPILRWLKDARNTVVKQGDLEAESKAIVKLATWRDDVLLEASVPPDLSPDLLLRNFPLLELIRGVPLPPGDLENAATLIERRWTVPGLAGGEILETLAQAYGFLTDLVLDAHLRLGGTSCIASGRSHDDFRSRHHPAGVLPCMALGSEQRTHRFDSSGAELQTVMSRAPVADRALAAARYGLTKQDQNSAWAQLDPVLRAERVLYTAKRLLAKDKALQRVMFLSDGHGRWSGVALNARNRTEKHVLMRMVARHMESIGGDALIDVGEAWTGVPTGDDVSAVDSSERAGRGEALYVFVATRDGISREYITPFERGPLGGIKLGDTVESATLRPYYLEPVFDVWRNHGFRHRADGQLVRRLWEPDSLDICYCGGPRRYGECCKTLIEAAEPWDSELATAVAADDLQRAEKLARSVSE